MGIRGTKTWDDVQSWLAAAGTVSAGSYTSAGVWTFGNATAFLNHATFGGINFKTSTTNRGYAGFNTRVDGTVGIRADSTFSGGGIVLQGDNSTNTAQVIAFYANLISDTTSTSGSVVGGVSAAGAWTFGPGTSSNLLHIFQGGIKANITTSTPAVGTLLDMQIGNGTISMFFNGSTTGLTNGESTTNTAFRVRKDSTTSRSINAAGTINASGADYAEYMTKANLEAVISKGEVVGVDNDGKLTKQWSEAVSFVVKSTDPSYVGGDTWFSHDESEFETREEHDAAVEVARNTVDRIAFAGQVPCLVTGSFIPGDWIVAQESAGDTIEAVAITDSSLTFEQYKKAIGQVWKDLGSGKALVAVGIK